MRGAVASGQVAVTVFETEKFEHLSVPLASKVSVIEQELSGVV